MNTQHQQTDVYSLMTISSFFIHVICSIRSFVFGLVFLLLTLALSIVLILQASVYASRTFVDQVCHFWGRAGLKLFGVNVQVHGLENIPAGSCLFLFSHTSFFDILALFAAYPSFRFGAKIELFSVPFFGRAMRRAGILPIARQNREEVFKVYEEARARTANGEKFALAPEGSRNTEEKLLPFKAGPFIFAINAHMPVVPVVIHGALAVMGKYQFLPNNDKCSRQIQVRFLPAIATAGSTLENRQDLQNKVYQAMNPFFENI